MVFVDYPRIKQSLGVAALRDAYPTLLLDQRATICGVNPLVLWMWGALKEDEPFHLSSLTVKYYDARTRRSSSDTHRYANAHAHASAASPAGAAICRKSISSEGYARRRSAA